MNLFAHLLIIMASLAFASFLQLSAALLPPPSTSQTIVVAQGTGPTESKALEAAYLNAVRQSIGVLVDAKTLISNNRIVVDEILVHSNGYIQSYECLKNQLNDDGLRVVTIKAIVKNRQLEDKLKHHKLIPASYLKVDGASIVARIRTQNEAEVSGARLLAKILDELELPLSLLKPEVVSSEPEVLERDSDAATLGCTVKVRWDEEHYKKVVFPLLIQTLEDICLRKISDRLVHDPKKIGIYNWNRPQDGIWGWNDHRFSFERPRPQDGGKAVYLLEHFDIYTGKQTYRAFVLDEKSAEVWRNGPGNKKTGDLALLLELQDSKGGILINDSVAVARNKNEEFTASRNSGRLGPISLPFYYGSVIAPFWEGNINSGWEVICKQVYFTWKPRVSLPEIEKIKQLKVSLIPKS